MAELVDLSHCPSPHSLKNRLLRFLWGWIWLFFFRPTPRTFFCWRNFLLRLFGAKIGRNVHVYPSVKIWFPANLLMADNSCLADDVDCYCVSPVSIGKNATVSQYSYLCTAGHDIRQKTLPLIHSPIVIADQAWVTARCFIGPGVTIGEGAVAGACACVFKDVEPWTIVGGNPAKLIAKREMQTNE